MLREADMDKMIIRNAKECDLPELLEVQRTAFGRYTKELVPDQIAPLHETLDGVKKDLHDRNILVAEIKGRITGSLRYGTKGGVCLIERLSVCPEYQRKGIGSALLAEAERRVKEKAHKLYLETGLLEDNLAAFYAKLGYSQEAILRKHYGGFDWMTFAKFI
jgi:ribosomal protein S18 acetylase RimI-like enzyme